MNEGFQWNGQNCLVTGGAGFGGSHLCEELLEKGANVYVYDRYLPRDSYLVLSQTVSRIRYVQGDLKDLDYLKMVLARFEIAMVFHLGAQPITHLSNDIPYETLMVNTVGTYNILEAIRTSRTRPGLVFASTGGYYGSASSHELIREEAPPLPGGNIYAASKVAGDIAVRYYASIYGIRAAVCRFMQTYGPGDTNFSRIIPHTIQCLIKGETPRITRSDGTPQWDFLHVRDMSRAYLAVAENIDRVSGEEFNFGGGRPVSVKEVVKLIAKLFTGREVEPEILMKPNGVLQKKCLDIGKAHQKLGWRPGQTLEDGIAATIEWYRRHWTALNV